MSGPGGLLGSVGMDRLDDMGLCEIVRAESESRAAKAAFAELYRRHRDAAMAQAYRIAGDRAKAEDLVSETFVRVLRALAGGNGPRESVLGYVLVSLRSEAIRAAKLEEPVATMEPDILAGLMDQAPDFSEGLSEGDQVRRAFGVLPESGRRVMWLLDVEGLSIEAAAEHLDTTPGALRVLAFRTRKRLGTAYLQQYVQVADAGCAGTAGQLAEYARESLGARSEHRVSAHLDSCPHCTEQVRRLRSLGEQLRAWIGPVLGGGAVGGLAATGFGEAPAANAAMASGSRSSESGTGYGATGQAKAWSWLALAAGVALLIAGVFMLLPRDQAPAPGALRLPPSAVEQPTADDRNDDGDGGDDDVAPGSEEEDPDDGAEDPQGDPLIDDTTPFWKLRER